MIIDTPYYEDASRYSNSDIGYFLKYGPKSLKDYKNGGGIRLEGSFLDKGTMIHEYILQPEEFWKDYVILDFEVPKVKQQKDFCEAYASSLELLEDEKKIKAYKSSYNNTKSSEIVLKEATELCDKYSQYIEYLKVKDNKKVISFADLNMLKKIEANIKAHKKANELLYELPVTFECHNEFHINWEKTFNQPDLILKDGKKLFIRCKSLLDRVCFDHVNKKIILIDLKTTQNVYNFAHSVEEYDYYRQIAYYGLAIQWYMQEILNLNSDDYEFEAYIIAIGKDSNNEIRVFNMKEDTMLNNRIGLISDTLKRISWHISTDQWEHTQEYYEADGIEEL
jgi:hypothetical protein